jgi:outer membrane receptor protein involved in Fe transport
MVFHLAFLLVLAFLPSDDASLSGRVFNAQGAGMSGAAVVIENTTTRTRLTAATADDGGFRFEQLALGDYSVTVHKEGFFDVRTEVKLEASEIVELTMAPVETRKEAVDVVVRPEPINLDSVSPEVNISETVIQNLPFSGRTNFLNAVTMMPGVLRDSSGQIHIDGSPADQIRYQLDGLNITDPSTGALMSNIPIDAIESVDVDLAGYSTEYGKGSGGSVRVHSQFVGDRFRWNVTDFFPGVNFRRATVSDFSPRLLVSGPLVKSKVWLMYSGALRYIRTFKEDIAPPDNRQNETASDQLIKLQWNLAESHVLTFDLLNDSDYLGNSGLSRIRPVAATTNFLRRGATASLSNRSVIKRALLETTVQWTHRRDSDLAKGSAPLEISPAGWSGNYFADRRSRNDRFRFEQMVSWETTWASVTHRFKAGAEFDHVTSDLAIQKRPYEELDAGGNHLLSVQFAGPTSAEIHNWEYGTFFRDRIVFSPKFQMELGARVDREEVTGSIDTAPRIAFSLVPRRSGRTKITGGAGLFYDSVALENLELGRLQRRLATSYLPNGTTSGIFAPTSLLVAPALKDPHALHWNLALEREWAPRWVSRISYVQKRDRGQVRVAALSQNGSSDLQVNNSGQFRYDGIEFSIDRALRTNIRVLASYTYSQARGRPSLSLDFPDPAVESISQAPAAWDTPHRFVTWGYFPFFLKSGAAYAVEARSGFPFTDVDTLGRVAGPYNGVRYPTFFSVNFSIEKEIPVMFGKRVAIRVGATNLFDRFNPRFVDANINSPTFRAFSDSSGRAIVARLRLIQK